VDYFGLASDFLTAKMVATIDVPVGFSRRFGFALYRDYRRPDKQDESSRDCAAVRIGPIGRAGRSRIGSVAVLRWEGSAFLRRCVKFCRRFPIG